MGALGDVMILWFLDVDCQRDKGRFIIGVQGNGMG